MAILRIYIFLLVIGIAQSGIEKCKENEKDKICFLEDNYNKNHIPKPYPCSIYIFILIRDVFNIDDSKDTITMSLEFNTVWIDSRVNYNASSSEL